MSGLLDEIAEDTASKPAKPEDKQGGRGSLPEDRRSASVNPEDLASALDSPEDTGIERALPEDKVGEPVTPRSGKVTQSLPVEEENQGAFKLPEPVEEALEDVPEEEEPPHKLVITIVGEKGTGKTVTALSFPGEICVMSFDRKAMPVKQFFYKGDKRIHVFDIVKYVDWRPERITATAAKAFDVLEKALAKCQKMGADWVVIDGVEVLEQLAEMYMRHRHGLGPIEGIRNLNIWKERKWILRDVHNKALTAAKRGVVYTVYPTWSERIVAGEVIDRKQEPRWLEVILFETDVVIWTRFDDSTKRFLAEIQTSKLDNLFPTGKVFDVTRKPLGFQVDWTQVFPDLKG